jgi:peroxiredoxin
VDRRLFLGSLGAAAVVGVGGGWLLARDDGDSGDTVTLDEPGEYQEPSIGTNAPVEGDRLPDIVLEDADGNQVALDSLAGQPLVLNFWYSSCQPCKKELPLLGETAKRLDGTVRFVGINMLDDGERAREFAADHGADYLQLLDHDAVLQTEVGIVVPPTTLFVAADGTIVHQKAGELSAGELESALAESFPGVG